MIFWSKKYCDALIFKGASVGEIPNYLLDGEGLI